MSSRTPVKRSPTPESWIPNPGDRFVPRDDFGDVLGSNSSLKLKFTLFLFCILLSIPYSIFPQSQTLFNLLSPKQTKIHFNNKLKDTKTDNILIYSNFYGGAGVGVGDINNDGLEDLFFAGNQVHDKLYLNRGNMEFEDISIKAGILQDEGWSSSVIVGDVNQDGWQDIYVTRELYDDKPELRRNLLYINQGNNTFTEEAAAYGIADSQRTRNACFLDYDLDGDLDLFLCNQPPNPGDYSKYFNTNLLIEPYSIRLYENTGGKFLDITQKAGLLRTGFPNSATASDLNGDGWTDIYVANDFWAGDWMFINNGDGTFTDYIDSRVKHISFSSMGVDAADINNDGQLDVMVLDMAAEDNYRSKANMSGMNPRAFWKVVEEGGHYQYMFNTLQLNRGGAYFSDIAQLSGLSNTDWSWANLIADLDNDGWKDVFVTNGLMRDIRNNDAAKTFKKYVESALFKYITAGNDLEGKTVWDVVNLDKTLNLVPSEKLSNYVYKNERDLTFSKKMDAWGLNQKSFSNGAAYADLDKDGDLDLVVSNVNEEAFIYQNNASQLGKGNYLRIQALPNGKGLSLIGTKVWIESPQGMQYVEITGARGMYSSSETIAHFGLGKDEKVDQVRIRWTNGKETLLKNIAANQLLTVPYAKSKKEAPDKQASSDPLFTNVTKQTGFDAEHKENEFDDYRSQVLLPHKMSSFGPCLAKGDLNGDGKEDVYVGGSAGHPGALFIQKPDATFQAYQQDFLSQDQKYEDLGAAFFDVDQDGDQDLYVVSGGNEYAVGSDNYQDRLYLNDGSGNFTSASDRIPSMKSSGSKVYPFDFDKDGDLDLFVGGRHIPGAYPQPASSTLLLNENGTFTDITQDLAPMLKDIGMVNDAVWMDYDQDGWEDLILVGEWMPIRILTNKQGKFEASYSFSLPDTEGWWFSLEKADIDNDGDLDLIAGNMGLNYKYKASKEEPFGVYFYDFDENGSKDVVLTYYNFGIQYPLRGRECSSEQVPGIKEKFQTYDLFASSDVFQIYGEDKLSSSLHYDAYTFASVYLENKGNGRFDIHLLPTEAQFSSVNDILIADVNEDEHLDVLLAGNLYDAEVETARNDAGIGLLLLGDGKGNFKSLTHTESGIFLPYDVKSLLKVETDKNPLILVGTNNDRLQVLEN